MPLIDDRTRKPGRLVNCVRSAAIAACVAATTGCSVYHAEVDEGFSTAGLAAQSGGAGIPLQVDGAVGASRGAALAALVAADMPATVEGTAVRYAPCEPFTECAGDHVVWTFGPPAARPASDYPSELHVNIDWVGGYEPSPTQITALVAIFQGNNVVATASGQVDAPQGANDPAFREMIDDMSRTVFSAPGLLDGGF